MIVENRLIYRSYLYKSKKSPVEIQLSKDKLSVFFNCNNKKIEKLTWKWKKTY